MEVATGLFLVSLAAVIGGAMIWWKLSAHKWFKAPEHQARLVK